MTEENMRRETVRDRCGVCGELGNHGDYPHSEAVASHYNAKAMPVFDVQISGVQVLGMRDDFELTNHIYLLLQAGNVHIHMIQATKRGGND